MLNVSQIKTLKKDETEKAILAVLNSEIRETARKTHFLSITLGDKTGTIPAKIWDWDPNVVIPVGEILNIQFKYSPYNDAPQIVITDYARVKKENLDAGLFIDSLSQADFKFYRQELEDLINEIQNKELAKFVRLTIFEYFPQYLSSVGGKVNHHSRLGGLIEHSVRVTRSAQAMANSYKGTPVYPFINMDLLIAGGILHDLGKIGEYTTENMVIDHSISGNLMSHYNTGPAFLMEAYTYYTSQRKISMEDLPSSFITKLIHIMVTHHGPEHSQHAPVTVSAWLIHSADISDCFIDAITSNLNGKSEMSQEKVWILKSRVIDERFEWSD